MIDEHAAHHLGGDAEEMRAVFPRDAALRQQPHVGFVDDGRRLQCLPGSLAPKIAGRQPPQLALDTLHELGFGLGGSLAPPREQYRYVVARGQSFMTITSLCVALE